MLMLKFTRLLDASVFATRCRVGLRRYDDRMCAEYFIKIDFRVVFACTYVRIVC